MMPNANAAMHYIQKAPDASAKYDWNERLLREDVCGIVVIPTISHDRPSKEPARQKAAFC